MAQTVNSLSAMKETWAQSLSQGDPLEKGMSIHSSILSWRIPWREETDELQSMAVTELDMNKWIIHACSITLYTYHIFFIHLYVNRHLELSYASSIPLLSIYPKNIEMLVKNGYILAKRSTWGEAGNPFLSKVFQLPHCFPSPLFTWDFFHWSRTLKIVLISI